MATKTLNLVETSLEERKELVQDVIDRLLSNPEYKKHLQELNKNHPPKIDYNRRLSGHRPTKVA